MDLTKLFDCMEEHARMLGESAGDNAAEWYIQESWGGRVTRGEKATAKRVLDGIEDCDGEVYDTFPQPDLSGEWSGDMSGPMLFDECASRAGVDQDRHPRVWERLRDAFGEVCDHYETAFRAACEARIVESAKAEMEG